MIRGMTNLWRIRASLLQDLDVLPLPVVVRRASKGILPAEMIPIGHFVCEDKLAGVIDELDDVRVCGRA